jgi:hypothetical protein
MGEGKRRLGYVRRNPRTSKSLDLPLHELCLIQRGPMQGGAFQVLNVYSTFFDRDSYTTKSL